MEWLLILGLGVWVYRQGQAIRRLERRLGAMDPLEQPIRVPAESPAPAPAPEPLAPEPLASVTAAALSEPLEAALAPEPEPVFTPPPETMRPERVLTRASIATWLSENGLAWIGGGGLALGGLLLVGYAAQRGLFTPELRIALAVILGGLMLGASEWILRLKPSIAGGRHLLAAAVSAGAGAVTLYGAVCAAQGLYHMIPFGVAAVLAASISLGLLALSLRHGQALALVAIIGALLTPSFTGLAEWSTHALTAYAMLIGVTGFSIFALRMWDKVGGATMVGLLLLSAAPLVGHHTLSTVLIQALAAIGPFAGVLWRRRFHASDDVEPAGRAFRDLPAAP